MSLGASLFLFRKTLPSLAPDLDAYHEKFSKPKPINEAFVAFVKTEIPKIFKDGWDTSYLDRINRVIVGRKSCLEKGDGIESSRDFFINNREGFMRMCTEGVVIPNVRKIAVAVKAGKARIITVASAFQYCLSPLASMIYDHLSRKEWLLRGTAGPSSFKGFHIVDGEVFVSGDYESATDNFNLGHSKEILRSVLDSGKNIPDPIKKTALDSLDCVVVSSGRETVMQSGQLMGDKLSFPLLCLTNYLAFVYALRPMGALPPVRINGDDIAFRSTRAQCNRWFDQVSASGLVVSKGKTMVNSKFFSLNSSFFEATRGLPKVVPFIRSLPLLRPATDGSFKLGERCRSCAVGFSGPRREIVRAEFLRRNKSYLWKSQVSLSRGHGIRVHPHVLVDLGLFEREQTYLSLPEALDCFPIKNRSLDGFKRVKMCTRTVRRASAKCKPDLIKLFINEAWQPQEDQPDSQMGPIRCDVRTLRKGVVKCGKFSHWFKNSAKVPRSFFMTPRAFVRRYKKENPKKGYVVEGYKPLSCTWVPASGKLD
jgi:hypothetical protein